MVFPLLVTSHPQRNQVLDWWDRAGTSEVALCRLTRLGALRLLSTAAVMGRDVLPPAKAMESLEILESDDRVILVNEPVGIDATLKKLIGGCATTPNLWTDAYLAAFASVARLKLVSFDRGFSKFTGLDFLLLASGTAK